MYTLTIYSLYWSFPFVVCPYLRRSRFSSFYFNKTIDATIIVTAIGWGYYAYVIELCINTLDNNAQRVIYLFFFHLLLGLCCASYYRGIFSHSRPPPSIFFPDKDCMSELESCERDEQLEQATLSRYVARNRVPVKTRDFRR
ncbi:hypothetical protein GCK32_016267 [Trichostrongylus colubriformis]|uniref:Uncharacterized protein n=1 Tax=Trichostrongylus colubriformis TaxID=6319 RepID=A0AAN8ENR2_TRICO